MPDAKPRVWHVTPSRSSPSQSSSIVFTRLSLHCGGLSPVHSVNLNSHPVPHSNCPPVQSSKSVHCLLFKSSPSHSSSGLFFAPSWQYLVPQSVHCEISNPQFEQANASPWHPKSAHVFVPKSVPSQSSDIWLITLSPHSGMIIVSSLSSERLLQSRSCI